MNVIQQVQRLRSDRGDEFTELGQRIFRGEAVEPEEADAILTRLGRCPSELDAEVSRLEHRKSLHDQIDAAEAAQKRIPALRAQIDAARSKLKLAQDEFERTTRPIGFEIQEIEQMQINKIELLRNLRESAPEHLKKKLERLRTDLHHARQNTESATRHVREREALHNNTQTEAHRNTYAQHVVKANEQLSEVAGVESAIARELESVAAEMLQ